MILVDEYDKPILDTLHDPDRARANRDYLRGFYGIVKGSAAHVRFVLVTGISMFSKVSLFSGLNNLRDISLDPRYATLCGYTDADLDTVFAPELDGLDREAIRTWYNGYNWLGRERLYNPFDVLLLLDSRRFKPWWFETGSPRFLFETLQEKSVSPLDLEGCLADRSLVSRFDVDDIGAEALLFQTGYLTITDVVRRGHRTLYRLDCPNQEVRLSLNDHLLAFLSPQDRVPLDEGETLRDQLATGDFEGFAATLKAWLAGIPYQWHATGDLARHEAWYASLLHMVFRAIGVDVRAEEATSRGRADMVVSLGEQVFILEFKMAEGADDAEAALDAAFAQMRDRGYADRYRGQPVHLVAVAGHATDPNPVRSRTDRTRSRHGKPLNSSKVNNNDARTQVSALLTGCQPRANGTGPAGPGDRHWRRHCRHKSSSRSPCPSLPSQTCTDHGISGHFARHREAGWRSPGCRVRQHHHPESSQQ